MNQSDPVRSISQRLWSVMLSALGLVLVANVVWSLLRPLLPVIVILAITVAMVAGARAYFRARW